MPRGRLNLEIVGGERYTHTEAQKEIRRLESLGIFGSGNDFNTFNPDVGPNDIVPQDGDFIRIPFRLLSATTVAAGSFRATSFPASVLREGLEKFINVPVFPNHDQEVGNELGIVESVSFVNAQTTKEDKSKKRPGGLKIPAGVEGILKIDAKANPSIARSVLTGSITSLSVTVDFEWVPSHKLDGSQTMRDWEMTIGQIGADGKMITRRASKIRDIYEASLVWLGADPYAKAIDESGQLVNIDTSNTVELDNFSYIPDEESSYNKVGDLEKRTYLSTGNLSAVYSFRREVGTRLSNLHLKSIDMKSNVLALILTLFSVGSEKDITEEMIDGFKLIKGDRLSVLEALDTDTTKLQKDLDTAQTSLSNKTTELASKLDELNVANNTISELREELRQLKSAGSSEIIETLSQILPIEKDTDGNIVELTAGVVGDTLRSWKGNSEAYTKHVTKLKEATNKLYALSTGGEPEEVMVNMINNSNEAELLALSKTYGGKAIGEFTGTCKDCSSTNITLQSSVTGEGASRGEVLVEDGSSPEHLSKVVGKPSMNVSINRS